MSNTRKEVIRTIKFVLFSASAGIIQVLSFAVMEEGLHLTHWVSYLVSLILSVLWNFTLNRKFTFYSANNIPIAMMKVAVFYLIFTPLSTWWTAVLTGESVGWNEYLVLAGTMVINFVTEYLYDRFVVFGKSIDTAKTKDAKEKAVAESPENEKANRHKDMNFAAFIDDIKQNSRNVFGVEVYVDGKLVHSYGDTEENRHPIYSATKTITSIAVGMAVDEGKLDINKSILEYLPAEVIAKMSDEQVAVYRKITTRHLLTMSVNGYPFRAEGESWLTESLNYSIKDVDNRTFDYSNVSAYLAGVVTSLAVKEDLGQYLERKLFEPLGIHNPIFARCPDGYFYGASSMELTVHELSKIGLLLYNNGMYEGQRILSAEYVKEATSIQQMNREGGYGYFIWKYRDGFSINGKWKQKCYVLPESKIMVTYLAHIEDETNELKESMEKYILGQ